MVWRVRPPDGMEIEARLPMVLRLRLGLPMVWRVRPLDGMKGEARAPAWEARSQNHGLVPSVTYHAIPYSVYPASRLTVKGRCLDKRNGPEVSML